MGLGLIRGAMKMKNDKNKDKKSKDKNKTIEKLEKKLESLYNKYEEKAKNIPDWAKRTDPILVGIEENVLEIQEKIAKAKGQMVEVI